jgi:hypothetical protein
MERTVKYQGTVRTASGLCVDVFTIRTKLAFHGMLNSGPTIKGMVNWQFKHPLN